MTQSSSHMSLFNSYQVLGYQLMNLFKLNVKVGDNSQLLPPF